MKNLELTNEEIRITLTAFLLLKEKLNSLSDTNDIKKEWLESIEKIESNIYNQSN